jgi:chromate transporter
LNIYLDLFLSFAQAGACTFGGGYAMLPILQREMVQKRHWVTDEELADYYAIGQCTPGIIAVNTATFVGVKQKGTLGGIVATLGVVFPSVVIITVIAAFLRNFADLPVVAHAFAGIRACVCVLIFNAVLKLKKSSVIDLPTTVIFLLTFLLSALWGVSPAIIVLVAGVVGLSITLAKGGLKK